MKIPRSVISNFGVELTIMLNDTQLIYNYYKARKKVVSQCKISNQSNNPIPVRLLIVYVLVKTNGGIIQHLIRKRAEKIVSILPDESCKRGYEVDYVASQKLMDAL